MCIVTVFVCNICTPWHKDNKIWEYFISFFALFVIFFLRYGIMSDFATDFGSSRYAFLKVKNLAIKKL